MKTLSMRLIAAVMSVFLLLQLAGCGTVLYPERRGQTKGEIDPGVAIIDAVGLLFFIIPGVAAFIIDFNTGAIYLPPGKTSEERIRELKGSGLRIPERKGRPVAYFDPKRLEPETFEQLIGSLTGTAFDLDRSDFEVYRLDAPSGPNGEVERVALRSERSTLRFD